jgi:di/tricarboxylate transporter
LAVNFYGFVADRTFPFARPRGGAYSVSDLISPAMNFATFLKTLVILAVLFVMLYVGMNNTHEINFFFPIAGTTAKKPINESAALIFFGIFAIGVLAGTMMHSGDKGGAKKSSDRGKDK